MESLMSELPLALFTTFSPVAAGAFGLFTLAFLTTKLTDEQARRVDLFTVVPLIAVGIGFICSFFHLASPLNAPQVFANVGSSPLSNEILVGCIFAVLAIIYWILGMAGKLRGTVRTVCSLVVAVAAAVFAVFLGMAYMMDTIAGWNTPFVIVQMLGYLLVGGSCFGMLTLALAGVLDTARSGAFKAATAAILVVGLVLAIVGLAGQLMSVGGLENAIVSGASMQASAMPLAIGGLVVLAVGAAAALAVLYAKQGVSMALAVAAPVIALVGIFVCRLAFYAMELSVGLYMGL